MKILKADASRDSKELAILLRLSDPSDDEHPGKKHVMTLLDHFDHVAFNGTHLCLVLPVMMSDGEMITMRRKPHQADYVRAISEQILLGLDFLHGLGIIHGGRLLHTFCPGYGDVRWVIYYFHIDLNPANILFSIAGATTSDDDISLQPPKYSPVTWLEGVEVDNSAPRYLMTSQRFCGTLDDADFSMLVVKIGDMGGGKEF